jgi:hypothetical protein
MSAVRPSFPLREREAHTIVAKREGRIHERERGK